MLAYVPRIDKEKFFLNLYSLCAHEAAHIRYSNYNIIAEININKTNAQKKVKELAAQWKKETDDTRKEELEHEIRNNIYTYLYNIFLFEMHNSYEDAFIEDAVVKDFRLNKLILPSIISLRNQMTSLEDNGIYNTLQKNPDILKTSSVEKIRHIITDLRHFATVGYRNYPAYYHVVSELFPNDLEEMKNLGIYAKLASNDTSDTYAAAKVAMKWLENDIQNITDEYYEKYMDALVTSDSNDLSDVLNNGGNAFGNIENEMAISQQKSGANGGGMQRETPPINLDLPSELENEIKQQKDSGQQGNSSNGSSNSSGNSSDSNDSGSDSENTSHSGSNSNAENDSDNDSDNSDSGTNDDSQSEDSSADASAGSDSDSESESEGSNDDSANSSSNNTGSSEGFKETSSQKVSPQDIADLHSHQESLNEVKKAIDALKKIEKSEAEKSIKKSIEGSGKAPSLSQSLGDINALSDMHKNIKISYHSPDELLKHKVSAKYDNSEELKRARRFSNRLKHVLLSSTKEKKISGFNKGRIDKKNLRRIVTDEKIFYKKIEGEQHSARICILVDESGSMAGGKCRDAFLATCMLVEACQKIRIPVAVFGHECMGQRVDLYHYKNYKLTSKYIPNLNHIGAGGCNHDSVPIFQCLTDMARQKDNNKETCIFIVISDGAPAGANGYYGLPAEEDIRKIISYFENKYNIKTIGIGIGDDVERIPYIYKNNVIVPDTSMLPDELLSILRKEILKKSSR